MTTIAYDGKVIAADSQICCGNARFGEMNKLQKVDGPLGGIFACAGDLRLGQEVYDWLCRGKVDPKPVANGKEITAIFIDNFNQAWELDETLFLYPACVPWAAGTGIDFALAAMHLGFGAKAAVELAVKLDTRSGGKVNVVEL